MVCANLQHIGQLRSVEGGNLGETVWANCIYKEEVLCLRSKRPRWRKMTVHREARCQLKASNEAWSLDFVHNQLVCGAGVDGD